MKRRQPRKVLGTVETKDGSWVEVKNPTVWNKLAQMQEAIGRLVRDGEKLLNALEESELLRTSRDLDVSWLLSRWWVRLGIRLRLLRVPRSVIPILPKQEAPRVDPKITVRLEGAEETARALDAAATAASKMKVVIQ